MHSSPYFLTSSFTWPPLIYTSLTPFAQGLIRRLVLGFSFIFCAHITCTMLDSWSILSITGSEKNEVKITFCPPAVSLFVCWCLTCQDTAREHVRHLSNACPTHVTCPKREKLTWGPWEMFLDS
jgi:hypothetical protein